MKRFLFLALSLFSLSRHAAGSTAQRAPQMPSQLDSRTLDHLQQQAYLQQRSQMFQNGYAIHQQPRNKKRWDYWSMGLGAGLGIISVRPVSGRRRRGALPDIRLGLERSWYLNDQWTLSVDLAFMTPAIRLGCIVNEDTRITFGVHHWMFSELRTKFDESGITVPNKLNKDDRRETWRFKNQLLLSPALGVDRFISHNCILRGVLSYDLVHCYHENGDLHSKIHWPQFTVSLNFRF